MVASSVAARTVAPTDALDYRFAGSEGGRERGVRDRRESGVIAQKPTGLAHEEATAVPEGSVLALAVGKHSFRRCRRSLKPGGIYISMDLGFMYHVPLLGLVTRFVGSRRATLGLGRYRKKDLLLVKELVDTGKYRPVIDRRYALDEIVEATRYVETGQKTGNVVLRVSEAAGRQAEPAAKREEGVRA